MSVVLIMEAVLKTAPILMEAISVGVMLDIDLILMVTLVMVSQCCYVA